MLTEAIAEYDDLYWEVDKVPDPPKRKRVQVEEESLDDSVPMVQTAASAKKVQKSALKTVADKTTENKTTSHTDSQTVASQATTISMLTTQVQEIHQTNNILLERFDMLAKQMATMMANSSSISSSQPAGGHTSGSSCPT